MAFLLRWIAAFALLAASYNPTDWNYLRWSLAAWETYPLAVGVAGALLAAAFFVALGATLRAIGLFGVMLTAAIVATAAWVLHDLRLVAIDGTAAQTWTGIVALSLAMAVGLWWRDLRRRLAAEEAGSPPAPGAARGDAEDAQDAQDARRADTRQDVEEDAEGETGADAPRDGTRWR